MNVSFLLDVLLPNYLLFRQWNVLAKNEKDHRIKREQHSESEFEYFAKTELQMIRKVVCYEVTKVISSDYPGQQLFDRFEKGVIFFAVSKNLKKYYAFLPPIGSRFLGFLLK